MSCGKAKTVGLLPVFGAFSNSSYSRGLPWLCPSDSTGIAPACPLDGHGWTVPAQRSRWVAAESRGGAAPVTRISTLGLKVRKADSAGPVLRRAGSAPERDVHGGVEPAVGDARPRSIAWMARGVVTKRVISSAGGRGLLAGEGGDVPGALALERPAGDPDQGPGGQVLGDREGQGRG